MSTDQFRIHEGLTLSRARSLHSKTGGSNKGRGSPIKLDGVHKIN
jgi:hypothetical protein